MKKALQIKIARIKNKMDMKKYIKWRKEAQVNLKGIVFELETLILTPEQRNEGELKAEGIRKEIKLLDYKTNECLLREVELIRGDL